MSSVDAGGLEEQRLIILCFYSFSFDSFPVEKKKRKKLHWIELRYGKNMKSLWYTKYSLMQGKNTLQ